MFFSGKKLKKAAQESSAFYAKTIQETQNAIAEAEKITEAGERYLAFLEIETNTRSLIDDVTQKADSQAEEQLMRRMKKAAGSGLGLMGAGYVTLMYALTASLTGAVIIAAPALVVTGFGVAFYAMRTKGGKPVKMIIDSKESFCGAMNLLLETAISRKDAILEKRLPDLLVSPLLETLCEKAPAVQTAFTKAAMKEHIFTPPVRLAKPQPPAPPK